MSVYGIQWHSGFALNGKRTSSLMAFNDKNLLRLPFNVIHCHFCLRHSLLTTHYSLTKKTATHPCNGLFYSHTPAPLYSDTRGVPGWTMLRRLYIYSNFWQRYNKKRKTENGKRKTFDFFEKNLFSKNVEKSAVGAFLYNKKRVPLRYVFAEST